MLCRALRSAAQVGSGAALPKWGSAATAKNYRKCRTSIEGNHQSDLALQFAAGPIANLARSSAATSCRRSRKAATTVRHARLPGQPPILSHGVVTDGCDSPATAPLSHPRRGLVGRLAKLRSGSSIARELPLAGRRLQPGGAALAGSRARDSFYATEVLKHLMLRIRTYTSISVPVGLFIATVLVAGCSTTPTASTAQPTATRAAAPTPLAVTSPSAAVSPSASPGLAASPIPSVAAVASPSAQAGTNVEMTNSLQFQPPQLTVPRGATVTWVNNSSLQHTVTDDPSKAQNQADAQLPSGVQPWDSGNVDAGKTYEHTFDVPGTYKYFCIPHESAGMTGTIIVTG
jgi:plastocyanin